jgi:hypothetical protein
VSKNLPPFEIYIGEDVNIEKPFWWELWPVRGNMWEIWTVVSHNGNDIDGHYKTHAAAKRAAREWLKKYGLEEVAK